MRERILISVNLKKLSVMSLFNRMSSSFLKKVAVSLERRMHYNSEIVIAEGDVPTHFFILGKGNLRVTRNSPNSAIDNFKVSQDNPKGEEFMWIMLEKTIRGAASALTLKSQGHSITLTIPKLQIIDALHDRKTDYESYCFLRDRISFASS